MKFPLALAASVPQAIKRKPRIARLIKYVIIAELIVGASFGAFHLLPHAPRTLEEGLRRSSGSRPEYDMVFVSIGARNRRNSPGSKSTLHPLNRVPQGKTILTSDPHFIVTSFAETVEGGPYVAFASAERLRRHEWAFTVYDGQYYRRGWVPESETDDLRENRAFRFYSHPLDRSGLSPTKIAELVPVTLPINVPEIRGMAQCFPNHSYSYFRFPDGHGITTDSHTWEHY